MAIRNWCIAIFESPRFFSKQDADAVGKQMVANCGAVGMCLVSSALLWLENASHVAVGMKFTNPTPVIGYCDAQNVSGVSSYFVFFSHRNLTLIFPFAVT